MSSTVSDTAFGKARLFARLIKVEHTIFALPFAYVGAFLAVDGVPSAHDLLWITVAMVGARSLAMALNRLIDAGIDARNPRTAGREIPSGKLTHRRRLRLLRWRRWLVFLIAVWQLNPVVRWLWPIPVDHVRRSTRTSSASRGSATSGSGAVDGLAPVGAWVAITGTLPWQAWALGGAVATWVAGFDIFYSLFDVEIDRAQGLHSWAVRFGERGAFLGARWMHVATVGAPRRRRSRPRRRLVVLGRRGRGRRAARLRALARPPGRPATARRGVLHHERRDQRRVLRLRLSRTSFEPSAVVTAPSSRAATA